MRLLEKGDYLYVVELGNEFPSTKGFAEYDESRPPAAPVIITNVTPVEIW